MEIRCAIWNQIKTYHIPICWIYSPIRYLRTTQNNSSTHLYPSDSDIDADIFFRFVGNDLKQNIESHVHNIRFLKNTHALYYLPKRGGGDREVV